MMRFAVLALSLATALIAGALGSAAPAVQVEILVEDGGRVAWSHARNLIAFDRKSSTGTFEIYTIHPDGSNEQCLTCGRSGLPRTS